MSDLFEQLHKKGQTHVKPPPTPPTPGVQATRPMLHGGGQEPRNRQPERIGLGSAYGRRREDDYSMLIGGRGAAAIGAAVVAATAAGTTGGSVGGHAAGQAPGIAIAQSQGAALGGPGSAPSAAARPRSGGGGSNPPPGSPPPLGLGQGQEINGFPTAPPPRQPGGGGKLTGVFGV